MNFIIVIDEKFPQIGLHVNIQQRMTSYTCALFINNLQINKFKEMIQFKYLDN